MTGLGTPTCHARRFAVCAGAPHRTPTRSPLAGPLGSRPAPELGTAKAQEAVPARRLAEVPVRRPHVLRVVEPGAAPDHAEGRRPLGYTPLRVVPSPGIRATLPHV